MEKATIESNSFKRNKLWKELAVRAAPKNRDA